MIYDCKFEPDEKVVIKHHVSLAGARGYVHKIVIDGNGIMYDVIVTDRNPKIMRPTAVLATTGMLESAEKEGIA